MLKNTKLKPEPRFWCYIENKVINGIVVSIPLKMNYGIPPWYSPNWLTSKHACNQ